MHNIIHVRRVDDGEWLSRAQPVPIFAAPIAGRSYNAQCRGSAIFRPCRMTSQGMDEHGLQAAPVRLLEALNRKARYRLPPGGQLVESFGLSRVPANAPVWRDRRQTHRGIRRHQVKGHATRLVRSSPPSATVRPSAAERPRASSTGGKKQNGASSRGGGGIAPNFKVRKRVVTRM